jgi:hypothetical protein
MDLITQSHERIRQQRDEALRSIEELRAELQARAS